MANEIRVRWDGRDASFEPDTLVRIGRDPGSEILLDAAVVSRRHGELAWDGEGWVYTDLGSSQGSFQNGAAVSRLPVRGTVEIRLGQGLEAPVLTLATSDTTPEASAQLGGLAAPTELPDVPGVPETVTTGPARPGGPLRQAGAAATVVTGQQIRVECGGRSYEFQPERPVYLGREDDCDVVSANPSVSRRHASLRPTPAGWQVHDEGSSAGTWVDGRRITTVPVAGTMAFWLGEPDIGERIVVASGGARPPRPLLQRLGRDRVAVGVALVALLGAAVVAGVLLLGGGSSGPDEGLLARATVDISAPTYGGSGTIIDAERGLILTNAHVAAPSAPGNAVRSFTPGAELTRSPASLVISVSPGKGRAAEPRFIAEPVAVDGYLDLAILQIKKTASGSLIEAGDLRGLTAIELGKSSAVDPGDDITVVGYPGLAHSQAATFTRGVVSGFRQDDRVGTNRARFNVDAEINPGNSGGLVADDGSRIVGVAAALQSNQRDPSTGQAVAGKLGIVIPVELAKPLIDAATGNKSYVSPYVTPAKSERVSGFRSAAAVRGLDLGCETVASMPAGKISIAFDYSGFPAGKHQDVLVRLVRAPTPATPTAPATEAKILDELATSPAYPFRWQESGCATVTFDFGQAVPDGEYRVIVYAGADYTTIGSATYRKSSTSTPGNGNGNGTGSGTTGAVPAPAAAIRDTGRTPGR